MSALSDEDIATGAALYLAAWMSGEIDSEESRVWEDWSKEIGDCPAANSAVSHAAADLAKQCAGTFIDGLAIEAHSLAWDGLHARHAEEMCGR